VSVPNFFEESFIFRHVRHKWIDDAGDLSTLCDVLVF
jgi:hypothetical protein